MTTAILINAILAGAILATIVGIKLWAIRTQHHDHAIGVERQRTADRRAHAHAPRAHVARQERRADEGRAGNTAVAAQS